VYPYDKWGAITLLNVLVVIACPLLAHAGQLWTAQAVDAGGKIVCDAFAAGAAGRPLYEFRFRRTGTGLLLIISYDEQQKSGMDGRQFTRTEYQWGPFRPMQLNLGKETPWRSAWRPNQ
jgi:hypothetical protein